MKNVLDGRIELPSSLSKSVIITVILIESIVVPVRFELTTSTMSMLHSTN